MRCHGFTAKTHPLAQHDGADQTCHAGIDMHNRTTGKVEGSLVEQPAIGSSDDTRIIRKHCRLGCVIRCRCQFGEKIGGRSITHAGLYRIDGGSTQRVAVGTRPPPDHMGHWQVGEGEPDCQEQQHSRELHAFSKSPNDQGWCNGGESQLESQIGEFRNIGFLGKRRGHGTCRDAIEKHLVEGTDKT